MKILITMLCILGLGAYLTISEVTYFILGDEVARLPLHQRLGNPMSPTECLELAASLNRNSPTLHSKCETIPLGLYVFEVGYNIVDQPWGAAFKEFFGR